MSDRFRVPERDRERGDDRFPERERWTPPTRPQVPPADPLLDPHMTADEAAWQLERCRKARKVLAGEEIE